MRQELRHFAHLKIQLKPVPADKILKLFEKKHCRRDIPVGTTFVIALGKTTSTRKRKLSTKTE